MNGSATDRSTMTKHLVLIFAYHFPPENAIGGARPFRFAKYLSKLGYTCHVVTAANQNGREGSNTKFVPDPFLMNSPHGVGWQLERAVRRLLLPGELGVRWSYHAYRAAQAYIRAHPNAQITILSTFPPLGPHLAAWQLARDEGLPWIADFRDPLAYECTNRGKGAFHKQVSRWLERILVRRADIVIANTDSALARWQETFPFLGDKAHLIWNGFDPEDRIQPLPIPPRDYKVLSHVGELYGGRNATPILESLARLIAAGRLSAGSLRVRLIGPVQDGTIPIPEFLERAKTQGWLELITKQIPQREARQFAQSSDGLLLLQPQSNIQVPGKLFEYLQIGRPILAFIQAGSPVERLLERSGVAFQSVYPNSATQVLDEAVARFFDLLFTPGSPRPWLDEQFSARRQAQRLDAIIHSLHGEFIPSAEAGAGSRKAERAEQSVCAAVMQSQVDDPVVQRYHNGTITSNGNVRPCDGLWK